MTTAIRPLVGPFRPGLALGTLALGMFVVGTAELVVVGILNLVAHDMSVSVSTAGLLVTSYALGISVAAPVITALTIRFGRRTMLVISLVIYIGGNIMAAVAVNYGMLLAARIIMGSIHGLFLGITFAAAGALVAPERKGQAMAIAFSGTALSTVLGVPLGTLVGLALGWRAAFVGIAILGVLALIVTIMFIPAMVAAGSAHFGTQARYALAPRVLAMLSVGLLLIGGQFTAFTYLAPFLGTVTHISGAAVSAFLFAYGLFSAIGTLAGGKFADRNATLTLIVANLVLVVSIGLLFVLGGSPVLAAILLAAWGLVSMGLVPSLQLRVITLAGPGGDLAATLGASAVNAGIAVGALIGGWMVAVYGVHAAMLAGAVMCAVGIPVTILSGRLRPADDTSAKSVTPAEVPTSVN